MAVKATINKNGRTLHCKEFIENPNKEGAAISIKNDGVITSKGPILEAQGQVFFKKDVIGVEELVEDIN